MEIEQLERSLANMRLMLVFLVVVGLLILAALAYKARYLEDQNAGLRVELQEKVGLLKELTTGLEKAKDDRARLLEGKLPGLRPIQWGFATDILDGSVNNIILTYSQRSDGRAYQHLTTLQNKADTTLQPRINVLLFDENGIQIGESRINDGMPETRVSLEAGEIHPYSAEFRLARRTEPKYFTVENEDALANGSSPDLSSRFKG